MQITCFFFFFLKDHMSPFTACTPVDTVSKINFIQLLKIFGISGFVPSFGTQSRLHLCLRVYNGHTDATLVYKLRSKNTQVEEPNECISYNGPKLVKAMGRRKAVSVQLNGENTSKLMFL